MTTPNCTCEATCCCEPNPESGGLKPGPLTPDMVPLLTPGQSRLLVRSYNNQMKRAVFIHANGEGDSIVLKVDEEGQTAPNCWGIHRFEYVGESAPANPEPEAMLSVVGERTTGIDLDLVDFARLLASTVEEATRDGKPLSATAQANVRRWVSEISALSAIAGVDKGQGSSAEGADTHRAADGAVVALMVDRFLTWRLPENFNPDGGVSFDKSRLHPAHWPVGTNLLDYTQATAMVLHILGGKS